VTLVTQIEHAIYVYSVFLYHQNQHDCHTNFSCESKASTT